MLHADGHSYWDSHDIGNCDTFVLHGSKGNMSIQKVIDGEKMCLTPGAPKFRPRAKRVEELPFWAGQG
jgi:hypothetical protein